MNLKGFRTLISVQFLVACLAIFVALPLHANMACGQVHIKASTADFNPQRPSLEQLRENMMAVHMTDSVPLDGVMRTGFVRPTLHFSIGEMVVAHPFGSWEAKRYAVLTQLETLEPQLLNVFHQDTFILGDLKLSPGSILIAGRDSVIPSIPGIEVIYFDPLHQNIREVIRETLEKRKKWTFTSSGGLPKDSVLFNGTNVNHPQFFSALIKKYPHLSFGLHAESPLGKIELRAREGLNDMQNLKGYLDSHVFNWQFRLEELEGILRAQDTMIRKSGSAKLKALYPNIRGPINEIFNLIRAEIILQEHFGKTLLGTRNLTEDFKKQVRLESKTATRLIRFLQKNMTLLKEKAGEEDFHEFTQDMKLSMSRLRNESTAKDFTKFMDLHPEITEMTGGRVFQETLKLLEDVPKSPENNPKTNSAFLKLKDALKTCKPAQCWAYLFKLLQPPFSTERAAYLNNPEILKNLSQRYEVRLLRDYDAEILRDVLELSINMRGKTPEEQQRYIDSYGRKMGLVKISN